MPPGKADKPPEKFLSAEDEDLKEYLAMVRPQVGKQLPTDQNAWLDPTASWYSSDAWSLFSTISEQCGIATAKFLFERCIKMGAEQQEAKEKLAHTKLARAGRARFKLPTIAQINSADRLKICMWWARLSETDHKLTAKEKPIVRRLSARYVEVGGSPAGFKPKLPPIREKRKDGSDQVLLAAFNKADPASEFSIERTKRGGKLTIAEFAKMQVPRFGGGADHVLRRRKFLMTGK